MRLRRDRDSARKKLEALIEEATVDCNDDDEQHAGFDAMLQDQLKFPFEAEALGEKVEVIGSEWSGGRSGIKAIVRRREDPMTIPFVVPGAVRRGHKGREYRYEILDLRWTDPPKGADWIEAYRLWSKG